MKPSTLCVGTAFMLRILLLRHTTATPVSGHIPPWSRLTDVASWIHLRSALSLGAFQVIAGLWLTVVTNAGPSSATTLKPASAPSSPSPAENPSLAACSDCTLKSMESSPDKEYCRAGMIPIIILLNGEMRARATWILFSLSFLQSPGEDKMKTNKKKKIPNTSSVLHDCLFPPGFLWNFKFLNLRKSKNVTRFLLDGQFMTVSVALLVNLNAKSWLSYQIEPYTALHTPAYISVSEQSCWNTVGSKYRRAHLKIWCRALCGKQKPPEDCNLLQWFWCYYTFNIISARSLCYGKFLANSMKIKGSTFSKDSFRE